MNKTPFLKGFHKLFGRAKKSEARKLNSELDAIRSQGIGQLSSLFSGVVEPQKIRGHENSRNRFYSPVVTFWAMLGQAFRESSLRDAVREVQAAFASSKHGGVDVENSTGSYSDARKRMPQQCLDQINERICSKMPASGSLLQGRRIMVVDATGVQLEDTPANQESYPQPSGQAQGCGFPVVQLVGLMNLASGALEHVSNSPITAHEGSIFDVELFDKLVEGDILCADRGFCSYLHFAISKAKGVDVIMRLNSARPWPKGIQGEDVRIEWNRPCLSQMPEHISEEEWNSLPDSICVRYIRKTIRRKGFRDQSITVATTLMEDENCEILEVYMRRWDIELCFDNIKTSMGMESVRAKSPAMALKVITMHIIAYNLTREMILRSAKSTGRTIERVSFKGAMDSILRFASEMHNCSAQAIKQLLEKLYHSISLDIVPDRPNRIEPRVRKRRPKPFPLMTKSRLVLKAEIIDAQRA